MTYNSLNDFLKYTGSSKEIALVMAKDEEELSHFREILDSNYFKKANDIVQLLSNIDQPRKMYFVADTITKNLYDFIIQYPTGQVEIFDEMNHKSLITTPSYKDVSLIVLTTKNTLVEAQKVNFSVLNTVGLTYQS